MKNKKILKIIFASSSILSLTAATTTVISCGHKKNSTDESWADFQSAALQAKAHEIVMADTPTLWKGFNSFEFNDSFKPDDTNETISVNITSTVQKTTATFMITYKKGTNYNKSNWKCSVQPPEEANWANFEKNALDAKASDVYNSIKTSLPDSPWKTGDVAVFDTFGAGSGGYKGMQGKPFSNSEQKTITAIISISGQYGYKDAYPIQATAHFTTGESYDKATSWSAPKILTQFMDVKEYPNSVKTFTAPLITNNTLDSITEIKGLINGKVPSYKSITISSSELDTNNTFSIYISVVGTDKTSKWVLIAKQNNIIVPDNYGDGYSGADWSIASV